MQKKLITLSITALSVLFTHSATGQELDEAKRLLDNERYASAETLLEQNEQLAGNQPELNFLLVKTYLEQDKINEAKAFVQKQGLADENNNDPVNRLAYVRYLLSVGHQSDAYNVITELLDNKKNRKDPALLTAMAEVYTEEENGDAQLAIGWLEEAEKRDKQNPAISLLKGSAYRKLSDASNAYLAWQEALKKDPSSLKARYLLGSIFYDQKNPDVYMEHFMKAYEADSTYAPVLEKLYEHYYSRNVPLAKKYLLAFIAHSDHTLQNDYRLTDMEYLTGEYKAAIDLAGSIIASQKDKAQPRLYKLIAYSYTKLGDTAAGLASINRYFEKETPEKLVAPDFELRAQLTAATAGGKRTAIPYYIIAAEMDSLADNKLKYATAIALLAKQTGQPSLQAVWLGKVYEWKTSSNNVDLFNWGLAHYTAAEYNKSDSVFTIYTTRYPDDIFGYYWRALNNAAIDTGMTAGLAIPHYLKVTELGEKDSVASRKMLLKAYGYLGGYEANITKDYSKALAWFEKYQLMEPKDESITRYIEILKKWIAGNK